MTWQIWTLATLVVMFAAIQYALVWSAIVDLLHRPSVRGSSHMFWALVITCIPVVGALAYGAIGPTSLRSTQIMASAADQDEHDRFADTSVRPANITAFRKYSGRMSDRIPAQRPGVTRSRAHNVQGANSHLRRPGA